MSTILWGILLFIAGQSGQFVLRGTQSSGALSLFGIGLIVVGIFQMVGQNSKKQQKQSEIAELTNKISEGEKLETPCTVTVTRDSSVVGMANKYEISLNGAPIGMLKNNCTLTAGTLYKNNLITSPLLSNFEFEAASGATIKIKFIRAGGKFEIVC